MRNGTDHKFCSPAPLLFGQLVLGLCRRIPFTGVPALDQVGMQGTFSGICHMLLEDVVHPKNAPTFMHTGWVWLLRQWFSILTRRQCGESFNIVLLFPSLKSVPMLGPHVCPWMCIISDRQGFTGPAVATLYPAMISYGMTSYKNLQMFHTYKMI